MIPRHAGTVIVGGGISGVALAYYLAVKGVTDVVLLERAQLGSGSTGSSFGGVRQQFSTPLEIELSKRGLRFWKSVEASFGHPCPFAQDGYLVVTARPAIAERLAEAAQLQRQSNAGPVHLLDSSQVSALAPWMNTADLAGASWTPEDGRVIPTDGLDALARAARELGVDIVENWRVDEIRSLTSKALEVRGSTSLTAERVIVAAGCWSAELVRPFGIDLGVYPLVAHYAITGPAVEGLRIPVTIDMDSGLVLEREGRGLCVIVDRDRHNLPPDYGPAQFVEDFTRGVERRAPAFVDLPIVKTMSALLDMSTDGHPYIGQIEERVWVMAGFSGHGTMHGPAAAQVLAGVIVGDPDPSVDLRPLAPGDRSRISTEWMAHGGTSTHN